MNTAISIPVRCAGCQIRSLCVPGKACPRSSESIRPLDMRALDARQTAEWFGAHLGTR